MRVSKIVSNRSDWSSGILPVGLSGAGASASSSTEVRLSDDSNPAMTMTFRRDRWSRFGPLLSVDFPP